MGFSATLLDMTAKLWRFVYLFADYLIFYSGGFCFVKEKRYGRNKSGIGQADIIGQLGTANNNGALSFFALAFAA